MNPRIPERWWRSALLAALLSWIPADAVRAQESLCAEVRIEINQELTLERQAFDASMRINNGLPTLGLDQVDVDISITDSDGNPVTTTSNPNDTNALFFVTVDSMGNIGAIDGTGTVAPSTTASINWLIIPSPGAGGSTPAGTRYLVGATLSYSLSGEAQGMDVSPDFIFVRPLPRLELDYFLPGDVIGDDAFTAEVEPPVPYSLGVRVRNDGFGAASDLSIESGQPRIVENELGLLVGFTILGSEVNGSAAPNRLRVDFGSVAGGKAGLARWSMITTLSGTFVDFTADFSHADELGGKVTSLIQAIDTHELVHDVLVDAGGRDGIRDFLAVDGGAYTVYESDNVDTVVSVVSSGSTVTLVGTTGTESTYEMTVPPTAGALYVRRSFGDTDNAQIRSVTRDDGKRLPAANAWFFKTRDPATAPWEHWIDLFDVNGGGTYTIVVEDTSGVAAPPVLAFIGDKVTLVGDPLGVGFLVEASDANGTVPELTTTALPPGASFGVSTNGLLAQGTFLWTPISGQEGIYPVRFTASDGALADSERIKIYVGETGEPVDTNGIPESLSDRSVIISNVVATTTGGTASVEWIAAAGIEYDIYASDDAFTGGIAWSPAQTNYVAASGLEAYEDGSLGTNQMRRYYQVVLGGEAPFSNGVWGVIRRDIAASSYAFISPPFRKDRRLDGAFGQGLSADLSGDDGGPGDDVGDELYILLTNGIWRTFYLDGSGTWRDESGQASTHEIGDGQGVILRRNAAVPVRLTFTGAVGNDRTRLVSAQPGWNLIALSEGRELRLADAFVGATGGGPQGGLLENEADQIVLLDESGMGYWLMFAEGWGAPFDGNWVDLATFQIPDIRLKPGVSMYYFRQPDAGAMTITY